MAYLPTGFSETDENTLIERTNRLIQMMEEEERARRRVVLLGAASALFAAARLGLIALPFIKARRTAR